MSSRGIAKKMMNTSYFIHLERVYCERHPYCQKCIETGQITPAHYVIHRQPLKEHSRPEDQRRAIYDPANFIAVCSRHWKQHEAEEIRREAEGINWTADTDEPPRYQPGDHTTEPPRYQPGDHTAETDDDHADVINFE